MENARMQIEGHMVWIVPAFIAFIGFLIGITSSGELKVGVPVTKTCYVTEWKTVKKNGQEWREPVKQICVKGESE